MNRNKCCGFFGLIFGHKFKSYVVKDESSINPSITELKFYYTWDDTMLQAIENFRTRTVTKEIRCKRCGGSIHE